MRNNTTSNIHKNKTLVITLSDNSTLSEMSWTDNTIITPRFDESRSIDISHVEEIARQVNEENKRALKIMNSSLYGIGRYHEYPSSRVITVHKNRMKPVHVPSGASPGIHPVNPVYYTRKPSNKYKY